MMDAVLYSGNLSLSPCPSRAFVVQTVVMAGEEVSLTRKDFDIVALLASNPGRFVSHNQLLTVIWGQAHTADAYNTRILVGPFRDQIGDVAAQPKLIFTEPGVGYRLAADR